MPILAAYMSSSEACILPQSEWSFFGKAGWEFLAAPSWSMYFTEECVLTRFNSQTLSHTMYSRNQLDVKATGTAKWSFVQ